MNDIRAEYTGLLQQEIPCSEYFNSLYLTPSLGDVLCYNPILCK